MKFIENFERVCRENPNLIAVRDGASAWTYSELNTRSQLLAKKLCNSGIGPGNRVAIQIEKSIDAVCATIAILRSGAAYSPLDPKLPEARRKSYVDLLRPHLVLTEIAPSSNFHIENSVAPSPSPSDPAYCLFTSGSTGEPKCIEMARNSLDAFVAWAIGATQLTWADHVGATAPLTFDLSTFDIFASLSVGATCTLYPSTLCTMPKQLISRFQSEKITVWYTTPHLFSLIARTSPCSNLSLRTIILAGDRPSIDDVAAWRRHQNTDFWNWYGPTETNVCAAFRLPPNFSDPNVPIGKSITGSEVSLRSESGERITSNNTEGEICVTGSGVMLGYRKGETIAPPSLPYRTGDYGMLLNDNIVFLGRKDHLVKIYGYRVSLLEVERALEQIDGVRNAVALVFPNKLHQNILGALVVSDATVTSEIEIQRRLAESVPTWMVPEKLFLIDNLPRSAHGKIDRSQARDIFDLLIKN